MREEQHQFELCIVGGGMAGTIAALAAARRGVKVALIQDRPVLGGNASSEIRMWICGAHGEDKRETGILEEIQMENRYRNPEPAYAIWDSVLYGLARYQPNLELFLNCSVCGCIMDGQRIVSVRGWQTTTQTWHVIAATLFVDASGDAILAPLSGAAFRVGREARAEFDESIAPVMWDRKTMGLSCLFQAREHDRPQPFTAPAWAHAFTKQEDLRGRDCNVRGTNFWWMEVGGEQDSIHDTERLRDELLKISLGVWNYVKNHSPEREQYANWALDWMGFLPGKRESRRYEGDFMLSQKDVEAGGRFPDLVAYGGWTMDDHFPAGFYHPQAGTIFHPAPSPFGIPYRTLYSRNIENLFCAGRSHSATHAAMSATRVMGTTSLMGQAAGTAAAIAVKSGLTPRGVYEKRLGELQQALMDDDCWLPWHTRAIPALAREAALTAPGANPEPLRNGTDRPTDGKDNGWNGPLGSVIEYRFVAPAEVHEARLVFDSELNRKGQNMRCQYARNAEPWVTPTALVKGFRIEVQDETGATRVVHHEANNYQRLVRVPLAGRVRAVRFVSETTWGVPQAHLFAFDVR